MLGSGEWLPLLTVAGAAAMFFKGIASRAANLSAVTCKSAIATTFQEFGSRDWWVFSRPPIRRPQSVNVQCELQAELGGGPYLFRMPGS